MKITTLFPLLLLATVTSAVAPHRHGRRQNAKEYDVLTAPDADVAALLARLDLPSPGNGTGAAVFATFDNPRFRGFSGSFTEDEVAALRAAEDGGGVVVSVREAVTEEMAMPRRMARQRQSGAAEGKRRQLEARERAESAEGVNSRGGATWGLQRISQEGKVDVVGGNATGRVYTYTWNETSTLGAGVDIYIMDSGIYTEHDEFAGGRAIEGFNYFPDQPGDKYGHGSHCAGSAAGSTVGVATNASLISVKVIEDDGLGSTSAYLAGLDYILSRHANRSAQPDFVASVVSISLSWSSVFDNIDTATKELSAAGIHVAIAAGNTYDDACTHSPASLGGNSSSSSSALVVGASTVADGILWFSSTGPCVDAYAPGADVVSAAVAGGPGAYAADSGTSMAAPHVAGLVAVFAGDGEGAGGGVEAMKGRVVGSARGGVLSVNERFVEGGEVVLVGNGAWEA